MFYIILIFLYGIFLSKLVSFFDFVYMLFVLIKMLILYFFVMLYKL